MVLIAISPLEVISIDNPHAAIHEHGALPMGWDCPELPQASEEMPSSILEVDGQVQVPLLKCSIHLWHGDPAWDHRMPARVDQHALLATNCRSTEPSTDSTCKLNADDCRPIRGAQDSSMPQQFNGNIYQLHGHMP